MSSNAPAATGAPTAGVRAVLLYPPTLLAIAVGTAIRLGWVLTSSFPRLDGGLFLAMIGDLQANGYRLPAFTSYDGGTIPFAYPPVAFYEAGLLADLTGWPPLEIVRLQPAIVSALCLVAFAVFVYQLTSDRRVTWMSTMILGILPGPFRWQAAGGGLTRSIGFLFALLLLIALLRYYQRGRTRDLVFTAVAGALALASHLDWSMFAVYTAGLLLVFYGRTRRALLATVLAAAVSLALASVWWLPVLLRHGPSPFVAMFTGSSEVWPPGNAAINLVFPAWAGEGFPVLSLLALAGFVIQLRRRTLFAPLLLIATYAVQVRGQDQSSAIPVALLGATATSALWAVATRATPPGGGPDLSRVAARVALPAFAILGIYAGMTLTRVVGFAAEFTPDHRAAFEWARTVSPLDSTFLVLSTHTWEPGLEWFPVLTERRSLTTATGYEPVPGEFSRRYFANAQAVHCSEDPNAPEAPEETERSPWLRAGNLGDPGSGCVRRWFERWSQPQYLFVFKMRPSPAFRSCCPWLVEQLRADDYPVDFENDDVVIFRVGPQPPTLPPASLRTTIEVGELTNATAPGSEAPLHSP